MPKITEFDLKKISYLLNASLSMIEKDHGSALVLLRKTLEKTIHTYYDTMRMEKPVSEEGYSTLSELVRELYSKGLIDEETFNSAEIVRRLGNKAAHYSNVYFNKSDVEEVVKKVCKVINGLLYRLEATNNSLYLLTINRGGLNIRKLEDGPLTRNYKIICDLLSDKFVVKKVFQNRIKRILYCGFVIDDELYDYLMEIMKIKEKLAVFSNKFSEDDIEIKVTQYYKFPRTFLPGFYEKVLKRFFIDLSIVNSAKRIALKKKYAL